ncbi:hypothetical protein TrRE_jg8227, partial [Triparma retinervis]
DDGELQVEWVGTYGNMYNNGFVQAINDPFVIPIGDYGYEFSIIRGPEDTNSYGWTTSLNGYKTTGGISQQFNGMLRSQDVRNPGSSILNPISIGADCKVLRISGIFQENGFACAEQTQQLAACATTSWIFTVDRL